MHPGFAFWHARRHGACGEGAGAECGPHGGGPWGWRGRHGRHHHDGHHGPEEHVHAAPYEGGGDEGGGFGVRRPLRFLAYKLELDEGQVAEIAAVLNDLKTERAQAAVDQRRTTSSFADVVAGDSFDEAKAKTAAEERTKSTDRVQAAVVRALGRIHAVLEPEQRAKLAYLLRTGALSI